MKTKSIKIINGKVQPFKDYTVDYKDNGEFVINWGKYQIRFSPEEKQMTAIVTNDGIARLVSKQTIPKDPVSGMLILKDRPEFHLEIFLQWCRERGIDTVRSKRPNRIYSTVGEITTDGTVTEIINDDGYPAREVTGATYVVLKYQFETILYTRESIFKLDIPAIEKKTPA